MSDEEDYMSESVLKACIPKDDRPGLLFSRKQQREHQLHKKQEEHRMANRPAAEVAKEKLEEGLNTALAEDNKGFQMLQKMGYKAGKGLGKTSEGISQPVKLEMKSDKSGLGRNRLRVGRKSDPLKKDTLDEFRQRVTAKRQFARDREYYSRCRRVCWTLDQQNSVMHEPLEKWYWPDDVEKENGKKENGSKENGSKENGSDDKETSNEKEDTDKDTDSDYDDDDETATDKVEEVISHQELEERIDEIVRYMRKIYHYCFWCGTEYSDEKDLAEQCPGPDRKSHEEGYNGPSTSGHDD